MGANRVPNHTLALLILDGGLNVPSAIDCIVERLLDAGKLPVLVLGPTSPYDLQRMNECSGIAWVAPFAVSSKSQGFTTISSENLIDINLFVAGFDGQFAPSKVAIVGDFLDNIMPTTPFEAFARFYSGFAARIKEQGRTAVLLLKSEMHDQRKVAISKRHADVLLDFTDDTIKFADMRNTLNASKGIRRQVTDIEKWPTLVQELLEGK